MASDIKKSILSGILICVGGTVFLSCSAKGFDWLGAFLFAAGLFTICEYGFNLYTGKVGYIVRDFRNAGYIGMVALTLAFNLLTTFLLGILLGRTLPLIRPVAEQLYAAKLVAAPFKSFVSAVLCGLLMFLSVDTWARGNKVGCFLYIPTFILCGFDHSIANSFYNGVAMGSRTFTAENALFVITVIIGNGAGGMLVPLLSWNWYKKDSAK